VISAAAVVVRWRGGEEIDACLASLLEHGGTVLDRVILVDSGSGDGGAARLAAGFPDVEVVALPVNRSFAHAVNTGVARVETDAILLLNPDTELAAGGISILADALVNRPDAAGVVPMLVNPDGSSQHRWQLRRLPTAFRLATGRPGAPAFDRPPTTESPVAQPAAAAWMIRRDVWRALEGFDESFAPAWWEDVDLSARLDAAITRPDFPAETGFIVVPSVRVRHLGGSSLVSLDDEAFLTAFARNLLRYAAAHHRRRLAMIRFCLRWSLTFRALVRPSSRRALLAARRRIAP
jgi:GT2 family glycosyltransferase